MSSIDCRRSICHQERRNISFLLKKTPLWWSPIYIQTLTCAFWIASCSSSSKLRMPGKVWTGLAVISTGSSKSLPITSQGWQQNTWLESKGKFVERCQWEHIHICVKKILIQLLLLLECSLSCTKEGVWFFLFKHVGILTKLKYFFFKERKKSTSVCPFVSDFPLEHPGSCCRNGWRDPSQDWFIKGWEKLINQFNSTSVN